MHAVARLALHPLITNIQTSWVKMGPEGASACLAAGANDLGGTLMDESHHARGRRQPWPGDDAGRDGGDHPLACTRQPRQRNTLYETVRGGSRYRASFAADPRFGRG